jgi:hypothetical protein
LDDIPTVTIIVPAAGERHLHGCISSLLAQTLDDIEILAVDTTDAGLGAALKESFRDPRLDVLALPGGSLGAALNAGIERARGRYTAFSLGTDLSEPWRFSHQADLIHRRRVDGVFSPPTLIDDAGRKLNDALAPRYFRWEGGRTTAEMLRHLVVDGPSVCLSTVMARTSVFRELGPFSERLLTAPDYEYWLRMAIAGKQILRMERRVGSHRLTEDGPPSIEQEDGITGDVIACLYGALRDAPGPVLREAFPDMVPPGTAEPTALDRAMIALAHPLADAMGNAMILASFVSPVRAELPLDPAVGARAGIYSKKPRERAGLLDPRSK